MGLRERFQQPGPKRILSLDGGGARGLLSLGILAQLERHLGERSGDPANFRLAQEKRFIVSEERTFLEALQ